MVDRIVPISAADTPRSGRSSDVEVIVPYRDRVCSECGDTCDMFHKGGAGLLCLACSDLDHLVFLPPGNAALTRRSRKASSLSAIVLRWSRSRNRYERQGVLVEEAALRIAEQQCMSDGDARIRRRERDEIRRAALDKRLQASMAKEINRLFPGCPAGRAQAIAEHAATRGSGRIGRSASGRALNQEALVLAVGASVRHQDTDYDELLMKGLPREVARQRVRSTVDRVLEAWRRSEP
jgi:hypothetical protein